jgi:hypothetical protein
MLKRFQASSYNGLLQLGRLIARQTSSLRQKSSSAPRRGGQPRIGINLQLNASEINAHCSCSRGQHRKLPGSPGNNTNRPRRASR